MTEHTKESRYRDAEAVFRRLGLDNGAVNALIGGGICSMEQLPQPAEEQASKISGLRSQTPTMALSFKGATDVLFAKLGPEQLGKEMDCAATSIRASRADVVKKGYRSPPPGWEHAIAHLARQRAALLLKLADALT